MCEPLIQVQDIRIEQRIFTTCTLTHSSVHEFLKSRPQILSATQDLDAYNIESKVLDNICLKYLSQPRYEKLLCKRDDTFIDSNDEDFMEHHLLSYAAKYWDKHLDDVPFSQDMCDRVEAFVTSSQFQTCLQVQSLVIEGMQSAAIRGLPTEPSPLGQFTFWTSPGKFWQGPHLKRTFPLWYSHGCGEKTSHDYYDFIGEWGHVLSDVTSYEGSNPGEIDRCFWGAVGENNFLHKAPQARYKSFMLSDRDSCQSNNALRRCYETIDASGQRLVVVRLNDS